MVVALIVIGVILFLAFDAWVMTKVLSARKSAGDYGSIRVPGESQAVPPRQRR